MTPKEKAEELSVRFDDLDLLLEFITDALKNTDDPQFWELVFKEFY